MHFEIENESCQTVFDGTQRTAIIRDLARHLPLRPHSKFGGWPMAPCSSAMGVFQ